MLMLVRGLVPGSRPCRSHSFLTDHQAYSLNPVIGAQQARDLNHKAVACK